MRYLYQIELNPEHDGAAPPPHYEFSQEQLSLLLANQAQLEQQLRAIVFNWHTVQLTERIILLIGACELLVEKATTPAFVINECITLAKKYGSKEGYKLVNMVLDQLHQTTNKQ